MTEIMLPGNMLWMHDLVLILVLTVESLTTSLYSCLIHHAYIVTPRIKERRVITVVSVVETLCVLTVWDYCDVIKLLKETPLDLTSRSRCVHTS